MKRFSVRALRILAVSTLLILAGGSAFARYHFDARFAWLTAWKANLGTEGWIEAIEGTVHEGMTPEDVAKLLGDTKSTWTPDVSTGIFESFKDYDSVWFYQTPYPTEVTIRPDGGENVEMKGAWLAFRNGNLVYCSGCAPS